MIVLRDVTLRRGATVLIEEVNWTIYFKQRIGMIGANGSGKTSFFSMLLGKLQPDAGSLELPKQLKIAHVAQETPAYPNSALDFVLDGDEELRALEKQLLSAEEQDDGNRIATLHAKLGEIDSYTAPARAAQLLAGLGFSADEQTQPVSAFSGGWRMRLNLAQALMCRSDILLLDEPTNHLDLDAVFWLEQWLLRYPGTLLLISHDREFLDKVVDHIAHISNQHLKLYAGNYSTFEKQRVADLAIQQATYEKQQKHIAHMQSFVDRFRAKASKARQAQSRMKAIERIELVSAIHADSPFQFHFKTPTKCPTPLLYLDDVRLAYGDKTILSNVKLSIAPKDRIALLGPNGAGKSTLIKALVGELPVAEGTRTACAGLKIGYFAQHQIDYLRLDRTPLQLMRDISEKASEQELRKFLGGFDFVGNRVYEPIQHFSGGEKSRLALAMIIWQQPNLLLLDEPTNHLDLEMREALSLALQEYEGAMILVSHDRFLVRTTADQLALVANGKVEDFEGDLNDYQKWLFNFRRQTDDTTAAPIEKPEQSRKEQRQLDAKQRELRRPLLQKVKKLEEQLDKLQKEETAMELILADETLYLDENKEKLQQHLAKQTSIKKQLQETEAAWLKAGADLDKL